MRSEAPAESVRLPAGLEARIGRVGRWLSDVYALELDLSLEDFVLSLSAERARSLLPPGCRSGVVVVEKDAELHIGLHLDPADHDREGTVIEETSHLVCVAWHAMRDLGVSLLTLELQAEVDRFVFGRLAVGRTAEAALGHFEHYRFAPGLGAEARARYQLAHDRARVYCRQLSRSFPLRSDTPALLRELRRFYRLPPDTKLHALA